MKLCTADCHALCHAPALWLWAFSSGSSALRHLCLQAAPALENGSAHHGASDGWPQVLHAAPVPAAELPAVCEIQQLSTVSLQENGPQPDAEGWDHDEDPEADLDFASSEAEAQHAHTVQQVQVRFTHPCSPLLCRGSLCHFKKSVQCAAFAA